LAKAILCLNVGSSSCKFSLYDQSGDLLTSGEVERIGLSGGVLKIRATDGKTIAEN
jgi:acetate kinase